MGVTVNRTSNTVVGSSPGCKWEVAASSLVPGLGSNAVLGLLPPPAVSRRAYYHTLKAQPAFSFKAVSLDGIPAVSGLGSGTQVQVDVGPTLLAVEVLSTVSADQDRPAAEQIATDALQVLCQRVACRR
jgi:hypothetical protein